MYQLIFKAWRISFGHPKKQIGYTLVIQNELTPCHYPNGFPAEILQAWEIGQLLGGN